METAMRTHYCGLINEDLVDQTVTLCGWVDRRRDHGGVIFLDMRDREGVVQVVFDADTEEHFQRADNVRSEFVLKLSESGFNFPHQQLDLGRRLVDALPGLRSQVFATQRFYLLLRRVQCRPQLVCEPNRPPDDASDPIALVIRSK